VSHVVIANYRQATPSTTPAALAIGGQSPWP